MDVRTSGGRWIRRTGLVAAVAGVLLLAGCFGGSDDTGGDAGGTTPGAAVQPSGQASAFPVPPSASPSPLPSLGSATNEKYTFTLTSVQQAAPGQLLVEGVLTPKDNEVLSDLSESGFANYEKDGESLGRYDFSAVRLSVRGDDTVYLPMRDAEGRCACTETGVSGLDAGQAEGVYVYLTAPENASAVDILVTGFPVFKNVQVSR